MKTGLLNLFPAFVPPLFKAPLHHLFNLTAKPFEII
jgi:hypothetical protein